MADQKDTPAKSSALFLVALSLQAVIAVAIGPLLSLAPSQTRRSTSSGPLTLDRSVKGEPTTFAGLVTSPADGGASEILLPHRPALASPLVRAIKGFSNPLLSKTDHTIDLERLLTAIALVESGNNNDAVGDGGKAIGAYQIHEIFVRDVNRIAGRQLYTMADRLDQVKCREMIKIYWNHYGKRKGSKALDLARMFNGGPNGDRKPETRVYARKIKLALKEL